MAKDKQESTEMSTQTCEFRVMDVEPPIATSAAPVAVFTRPASRSQPTRPSSALPFGSSCGSAQKRPSTARATLASSHRRFPQPTSGWSFLAKTPQESNAHAAKKNSLPHRPATAREKSLDINAILPKRPVTARAKLHSHSLPDPHISQTTGWIKPVELVDARAIREAAHHEVEQQEYVDPLHGKSVEPRNMEMTARSSESISNAVNLQESLRVKAFQARARGNYALAISQYTKLLEIAPRDPVALFQLAVAYEKTGDLHRALTTYEKVVSLDEDNYFAYYNVGNILMRKNKLSEAIQSYTRAIEKCDPRSKQHLVFYRQRGAAYRKRGDFEHASHDYAFYHSRSGHQVKQDDRPWDCQPVTDAENDEGECERLRSDRGLSGTGHYPLSGRVVYNSDSLYAVPESSDSDKSEIPYQTWSHHRVFEIERLRGSSRTREDLLFVMDTLRKVFPFCASLREEAAALLCAKLIATENIRAGTPLFFEKAHGTHVFFICKGCVVAHKTVVQHIVQVNSSEQVEVCADNNQGTEFAHSWESLRSGMVQNESDDEAFPETVVHKLVPITPKWKKQQVQLCQLGAGNAIGFQGRYANNPRLIGSRTYSAIVAGGCDILALSWDDLREVERIQQAAEQEIVARFLRTVPVFHGIPQSELSTLALHAKRTKIVGSKVVCSEGQYVDGMFVVREGEVCQVSPSHLRLPLDLSIAFNLCGSFAVQPHEQEKKGLEFFTQLEHAGDPLAFVQLNNVVHGFLPHDFLEKKVQHLSKMIKSGDGIKSVSTEFPQTRKNAAMTGSSQQIKAMAIHRGGFFFASSSWIPIRKSRESSANVLGVACAKSALISHSSADLLFFTSADLTSSLSSRSRELLQRNAQVSTKDSTAQDRRDSFLLKPNETLSISNPPIRGHDMLEEFVKTKKWNKFKDQLIQTMLQDKKANKPRNIFRSSCKT